MISVVNYGIGNVQSVLNALEHLGIAARPVGNPAELDGAERILLPGVGAYGQAMARLNERGLSDALRDAVLVRKRPILGICLGMQLLADEGTEFGVTRGLGLLPGRVEAIDVGRSGLKLPHIGWNDLKPVRDTKLLAGLPENATCYYAHSFVYAPNDGESVKAVTDYGGPLVAVVASGNVWGTQFHPEKSQEVGMTILRNFAAL